MYKFKIVSDGFGLAIPLSVVCFPSAVIFPSFQQTSLTQFNDFNDAYLGCMEFGIGDRRKMHDDENGEAHFAKNVFIPQGAEALRDSVDVAKGNDHNEADMQTRIIGCRLRTMADDFEWEFTDAAIFSTTNAVHKPIAEKLLDGAMNIVRAVLSLF